VRLKRDKKEKRENWLLVKERDPQADEQENPVDIYTTSVASGRDTGEIAKTSKETKGGKRSIKKGKSASRKKSRRNAAGSKLPGFVEPALATLVDDIPHGKEWLFEMK